MTIKQFAEGHEVTPQAVYQKIRRNKDLKLCDLVDNAGNLTENGVDCLSKLFTEKTESLKSTFNEDAGKIKELEERLSEREKKISELEERLTDRDKRIHELELKVTEDSGEIRRVTDLLTAVENERDFLRQDLQSERAVHMAAIQALPQPKEGIGSKLARLFGKKRSEE